MGVMATYCQICGIPVHQDHYVPTGGMLGIYRGGTDHEVVEPLVAFGPDHLWLKDAVGLALNEGEEPIVIEGEAHDGGIGEDDEDGCLVMDGIEDRVALHRACWELAGKPDSWEEIEGVKLPDVLESYREQLFEFKKLVADGRGWMLLHPGGKTPDAKKNRTRILAALGRKG